MKRKILFMVLPLVVAIISFQFNGEKKDFLMLKNIEALASGEGNVTISCFGNGSVDCPDSYVKVYLVKETHNLAEFN